MTTADRCLFCRIAAGEIPARKVVDEPDVVAFEDINPQAPTHVLLIPRKHIAAISDLTEADQGIIGTLVHRASRLAHELGLSSDGYRLVFNSGEAAGQTVFHVHLHLLGGRGFTWPPG